MSGNARRPLRAAARAEGSPCQFGNYSIHCSGWAQAGALAWPSRAKRGASRESGQGECRARTSDGRARCSAVKLREAGGPCLVRRLRIGCAFAPESARGLAHSKTLRVFWCMGRRASVLECASPLALLARREGHSQSPATTLVRERLGTSSFRTNLLAIAPGFPSNWALLIPCFQSGFAHLSRPRPTRIESAFPLPALFPSVPYRAQKR